METITAKTRPISQAGTFFFGFSRRPVFIAIILPGRSQFPDLYDAAGDPCVMPSRGGRSTVVRV
jgi:hypothetical protein